MRILFQLAVVLALALFPAVSWSQTSTSPAETTTPEAPATDTSGVLAEAAVLPETLTMVEAGLYVLRLANVSPRDGRFDVDMWLWFRWSGTDARPHETFELANGIINSRSETEILNDSGVNYATVRVQGTIFHDFDVRRYPLDNHVILIELEDASLEDKFMQYIADSATALDPEVVVSGWKVGLIQPRVESHRYPTDYGYRTDTDGASAYSRLIVPISLDRTSYGPLFKSFWISLLSVVLGLLTFLVKSDDLDARFGMGVGAVFAASANAFVISDSLPKTTIVTLAEQINLIAVGVIFLTVFISIWSLRLRYAERDEASLRLDRIALVSTSLLYLVLNIAVLTFDLSW